MKNFDATAARPDVIEDPSNLWLIHPIADRLLPGALRLGIHPNIVSFAGLGCGILAGACYRHWQHPLAVVAGLVLMLAWHVMDGLDGKLARASGKASAFGRVIDGLCDYMVFIVVLIPLALTLADWRAAMALAVISGACHAVQSAWYEGEREAWKRRARGIFVTETRPPSGISIEAGYNWVESHLGSGARAIDSALRARPALLQPYLERTAPLVRGLSLLSANNRTFVIAIACLAGNPRFYWYWEIFGLTLLALLMALRLRQREAGVAELAQGQNAVVPPVRHAGG